MKLKVNSSPDIYFDTKTLTVNCIGVGCSRCPYRCYDIKDVSCAKKSLKSIQIIRK